MITIVDYGIGNLGSIPNMLRRLGADAVVTSEPRDVDAASRLILPGVGSFDAAVRNLQALDLVAPLNRAAIERRIPVLGLCLGMQLLTEGSEEGVLPGLGWVRGRVVRFAFDGPRQRPVPHMGWADVEPRPGARLLAGFDATPRFYFAHSYHVVCSDEEDVAATANYGYEFVASVARGNVLGAQFHPEKSHRFGLQLFRNFLEIGT